jgi:Phage integrase, N-terminal SAM-like domain.
MNAKTSTERDNRTTNELNRSIAHFIIALEHERKTSPHTMTTYQHNLTQLQTFITNKHPETIHPTIVDECVCVS